MMHYSEFHHLVNGDEETVELVTNEFGLYQLNNGNMFYVWEKDMSEEDEISLTIPTKDISYDSDGNTYVVDGYDVVVNNYVKL